MAFKVVVRPIAFTDIDQTTRDIADQGNPQRASRWREAILDAIESLSEMPNRHAVAPESDDLGVELRQFHHHSHRVIFRVVGDTVEVLRVYHGARQRLDPNDLP